MVVAGLVELEMQLGVAWLEEAEVEGNMEAVVLELVGQKLGWVFQVDKDLQLAAVAVQS